MAPYIETHDHNRGASNNIFNYFRCTECGLVTLVNVPEDLGRHYVSGYHELPTTQEAIEQRVRHEQYKIEIVRRFVEGGRLLEIGPSWGSFCLLAKRHGFSVEAIEQDPECCEFLTSRIQVKAILAKNDVIRLDRVTIPNVIVLWHSIEHLREPWGLLKSAAARLAPGGILVVATPNPEALQFRLFRRFWAHLDAPRHVNLIPAKVLRRKMQEIGLTPVFHTTRDAGSLECNVFGWRKSLSNLVNNPSAKRAVYYWGRLAADIAKPVEGLEGRGAAYTAVFRKPKQHETAG